MSEEAAQAVPIPADQVDFLIATAARAPSVHNTQPWRFRVGEFAIELYADTRRKLQTDPLGREMLISCGAALFGLGLAVRSLGYLPVVELLPDPAKLRLLARVRLGSPVPMTARERQMLEALPHRHTHRGPFDPGIAYRQLADIVGAAGRRQDLDLIARTEMRRWSRAAADSARDGVPAHAFPASSGPERERLPQRDFDLGRGLGLLPAGGPPPAVTAVLLTPRDGRADWLRAGQALHRLLAHAASRWVFACLYTQPLEAAAIRALIKDRLALPGAPQMVLQLGLARTTRSTARRPPAEVTDP